MLCNVADLLARPGARRPVSCTSPIGAMAVAGTRVGADSPVAVEAVLEWVSEGVLATGRVGVAWEADCRRCLTCVRGHLDRPFQELFLDTAHHGRAPDDEGFAMSGEAIDLEPLAREVVILGLPLAPLCDQTCQGLCPRCGADLNEGPCSCPPPDPDPRWAALDVLRIEEPTEDD